MQERVNPAGLGCSNPAHSQESQSSGLALAGWERTYRELCFEEEHTHTHTPQNLKSLVESVESELYLLILQVCAYECMLYNLDLAAFKKHMT